MFRQYQLWRNSMPDLMRELGVKYLSTRSKPTLGSELSLAKWYRLCRVSTNRYYQTITTSMNSPLHITDPKVASLLLSEKGGQESCINLMAMESYPTRAVFEANNTYLPAFEGYPGKRYHLGTKAVDEIEKLCWERALTAFDLNPDDWAVNVQALSGSLANTYCYAALLNPGDTLVSLQVSHGGHISHGYRTDSRPISETAYKFQTIPYHIDLVSGFIDYDELATLVRKHRPRLIVVGGSAYCRHIDFKKVRMIADAVGSFVHYDMSHVFGLVVAGIAPTPFPFCDIVTSTTYKTFRGPPGALIISRRKLGKKINTTVFPRFQCGTSYRNIAAIAVGLQQSRNPAYRAEQEMFISSSKALGERLRRLGYSLFAGGTDTHMLLIDLASKNVSSRHVEKMLDEVGILANLNPLPGDAAPRFSGLRLATPPMVIRGMEPNDFEIVVADLVHEVVEVCIRQSQATKSTEERWNEIGLGGGGEERILLSELRCLKKKVAQVARRYPVPSYLYSDLNYRE